jgi:hypothetical protein
MVRVQGSAFRYRVSGTTEQRTHWKMLGGGEAGMLGGDEKIGGK